jgi:NADH:ubiquinone oxidoreductase subunit 3 (subunit A)
MEQVIFDSSLLSMDRVEMTMMMMTKLMYYYYNMKDDNENWY